MNYFDAQLQELAEGAQQAHRMLERAEGARIVLERMRQGWDAAAALEAWLRGLFTA